MGSATTARNILLVGGGLGIGLEATKHLISTTSCSIVVFGLHISPECNTLQTAHPDRLLDIKGDVTNSEDRGKAVTLAVEKMGGIDTLVYCAGIMSPIQKIGKVDLDAFKTAFEVNVFGAVGMVCFSTFVWV